MLERADYEWIGIGQGNRSIDAVRLRQRQPIDALFVEVIDSLHSGGNLSSNVNVDYGAALQPLKAAAIVRERGALYRLPARSLSASLRWMRSASSPEKARFASDREERLLQTLSRRQGRRRVNLFART